MARVVLRYIRYIAVVVARAVAVYVAKCVVVEPDGRGRARAVETAWGER